MLRTRLAGGLQGVRQGLFAAAGGVEVVGQVEDAVGGVCMQRQGNAMVQLLAPLRRKPRQEGGADLVVDESAADAVRADPHVVPLAGLLQSGDGLRGVLPDEFRGQR